MKWILKAVVQKGISWLPASQKINYLFQKHVTKGVLLSEQHFSDKLGHAVDHLTYYKKYGKSDQFKALELGSGWYPVVPVALYLGGAREIHSFDISSLMEARGIRETIKKYIAWRKAGKLSALEPFILEERWKSLVELNSNELPKDVLLAGLGLELHVQDARKTGFPDDYFHLVCSNNTYEHIYRPILQGIVSEFQRVLKPGGVSSHFIDMSDHFAHLDTGITIYNFLRYSKRGWEFIDNSVQPQNRMRKRDYLEIYEHEGSRLLESKDRPGDLKALKQTRLHPDFEDHYSREELGISHTHLVSSK